MSLLSQCHDGHVDQLKGLPQGFCRRRAGGACGIASIQARQTLVLVGQVLMASPFQKGQDAQGQREHVHQTRGPLITLHIHRSERERLADHSANPPLHQVLFTRGQHRLLQREHLVSLCR